MSGSEAAAQGYSAAGSSQMYGSVVAQLTATQPCFLLEPVMM
jgi:hypothetical protein